ncbi:MAG: hypothetical protein AAFX39_15200 [Pseudomonadota bacterium]
MTTNVLLLAADDFISRIRLEPILAAAKEGGLIDAYALADRDMNLLGPDLPNRFSHVIAHRNLGSRQIGWLKRNRCPFLYDVDDFVLALPNDLEKGRWSREAERIVWCLSAARVVTATSRFLAREMGSVAGVDVIERFHMLHNGLLPERSMLPRVGPARRAIWVSSDLPLIFNVMPDVVDGIADGVRRNGLDLTLIGRFPEAMTERLPVAEHIPFLPPAGLARRLAESDDMIGLAPMVTGADPDLQRFSDAKSDIKIVDFHGHGVPALFSAARPYVESSISPTMLVENTGTAWAQAIDRIAADPAQALNQATIGHVQAERSFQTLAHDFVATALPLVRTDVSGRLPAFPSSLRRLEKGMRGVLRRKTVGRR